MVIIFCAAVNKTTSVYMFPSQYFESGSRIFCEKFKSGAFDKRLDLLTCDVVSKDELVITCVVIATAPKNVSINWLMVSINSFKKFQMYYI